MELETKSTNKGFYIGKNSTVSDQEEIMFAPNHSIIINTVYKKTYEYEEKGVTHTRTTIFFKGKNRI